MILWIRWRWPGFQGKRLWLWRLRIWSGWFHSMRELYHWYLIIVIFFFVLLSLFMFEESISQPYGGRWFIFFMMLLFVLFLIAFGFLFIFPFSREQKKFFNTRRMLLMGRDRRV